MMYDITDMDLIQARDDAHEAARLSQDQRNHFMDVLHQEAEPEYVMAVEKELAQLMR